MMNRRDFLVAGAACAVSFAVSSAAAAVSTRLARFPRLYAPHFGMFRHHAGSEPIDQIRFMHDEGFGALEDAGLRGKSARLQSQIGDELARRGMTMGMFVGMADFGRATFASSSPEAREPVLNELRAAADAAQRVGGRFLAVVPGKRLPGIATAVQMQNARETLQRCADFCERRDLVLLLEPIDHGPGSTRLFLQSAQQGAELCRLVGRPSCRLFFDVFQQAACGSDRVPLSAGFGRQCFVSRVIEDVADTLGYVQLADYPRRKEPGTGELDIAGILATLDEIGYTGPLGMEHGNARAGREGERAVIDAYAALGRHS